MARAFALREERGAGDGIIALYTCRGCKGRASEKDAGNVRVKGPIRYEKFFEIGKKSDPKVWRSAGSGGVWKWGRVCEGVALK